MDEIRPIGQPPRVERTLDQREKDARERQEKHEPRAAGGARSAPDDAAEPKGPYEGDDGHLHIDVRA